MGLIIKCNHKNYHLTYSEFDFIKNQLSKSIVDYIHINFEINNIVNLKKIINGIHIFIINNHFTPNESSNFIKSIIIIHKFINFTENMYKLCNLFMYSIKSNNIITIN